MASPNQPAELFPPAFTAPPPAAPVEVPARALPSPWPLPTQYDPETAEAIDWFRCHRHQLPQRPFHLCAGCFVRGPAKFYESIDTDIAAGPRNPRAWSGILAKEIARIREVFELNSRAGSRAS